MIRKIGFIGLGLIGGSIAMKLRENNPSLEIIAASGRTETIRKAYDLHIITNNEPASLSDIAGCDYVFLCAPTRRNLEYLSRLKPQLGSHTIITDVGSTKTEIHEEVIRLGLEEHFIGGHPMAGSEKTGIDNASPILLENAYYIITPTAKTPSSVIDEFTELVRSTGAIPMQLDFRKHDHAVAAISHLPHMISFALTNLVQEEDDAGETMKTISAGSFRDMTRVAASSPEMWQNICMSNRTQILDLMDDYMERFKALRTMIAGYEDDDILRYFASAKEYRDSLAVPGTFARRCCYELYVDLRDEAGGIAIIASLLAFRGISLKNIGIINNREFADGVLRIEFYDRPAMDLAREVLSERNYLIHER